MVCTKAISIIHIHVNVFILAKTHICSHNTLSYEDSSCSRLSAHKLLTYKKAFPLNSVFFVAICGPAFVPWRLGSTLTLNCVEIYIVCCVSIPVCVTMCLYVCVCMLACVCVGVCVF